MMHHELLHDDDCLTCRVTRRRRRREFIVRWTPAFAIGALVALMALGEALTHAIS